jgi:transposase
MVAALGVRQAHQPVEVFWVEASHCTHAPSVQRGWGRKGHQVKVPPPTQRQRATRFGAVPLRTPRFYWKRAVRGTSTRFLEFLHQLPQRCPPALLILILDHAPMHKSRAVTRCLTQHDWVVLEHWAPYAPEYNPIERCWPWRKAKGYGATACETIDDVITRVRQLVWHDHEGWLTSTIHFDFTEYQSIL